MPFDLFKNVFGKQSFIEEVPYHEAIMEAQKTLKDKAPNTPLQIGRYFFRKQTDGTIKMEGKIH
ncbi:MAG: hypothetical protein Q7S21_02590 [archaeon]|nr:hypothetical protein [archaeon]